MSDKKAVLDIEGDEFPLYTQDPEPTSTEEDAQEPVLDSDTVSGIQAVTASARGPNKLVATDNSGKLPSGIIPTLSGAIVQIVGNSTGDVITSATNIPFDDTIPQNTEGVEVITQAITPAATTNTLYILVSCMVDGPAGGHNATVALFQDSTANALAAADHGDDDARAGVVTFVHKMTAGTTSSTTFKVRAGTAGGTITINGELGGRKYGGVASSSITIVEVSA